MKKIKFKKLSVGFLILAIIGVSSITYYFYGNNNIDIKLKPSYTETSYVEAKLGAGALMKIKNPKYTSEIVNSSDIIIKGQIVSSSRERRIITLQEGTPEKALADKRGKTNTTQVVSTNYTIKVIDTLKGKNLSEKIILNIPQIYEDLVPKFQNDDVYIHLP